MCNLPTDANANPSHLLLHGGNRILQAVKSSSQIVSQSSPLTSLRLGQCGYVTGLDTSAARHLGQDGSDIFLARLRDLGFVPGARCEVVARMWLGGDPVAVRIGGSTFALRRAEAAAVQVELQREPRASVVTPESDTSAAAA